MRKLKIGLIVLTSVATACAVSLAGREAFAVKAGGAGTSGDACMEAFNECQRGCGPSPSTANPSCMRYCEEEVLAKCKAGGGSATKGQTIKPGVGVKGGLKAQ
ncbi:MAG: hypothetical protein ACRECX_10510 [Methyloceanibacter sp.]|uniref:hypothetical protein n=1 Tax=Methyloceanibacter sp. TaxID=1965321 RepID=UPI003D6CB1D4